MHVKLDAWPQTPTESIAWPETRRLRYPTRPIEANTLPRGPWHWENTNHAFAALLPVTRRRAKEARRGARDNLPSRHPCLSLQHACILQRNLTAGTRSDSQVP